MRTCTKCKISQPLTEFTKHAQKPDGIRPYCRGCAKKMKRTWYEKNYVQGSDYYKKVQEASKKRIASGANAESCRRKYSNNKEKYRLKIKEYRLKNPDKVLAWSKHYKHRKRSAIGDYTLELLQGRIDYYGGKCWICSADYQEIDHVKPLSKGGWNWPANLRPICSKCNKTKSAKWPLEKAIA